MSSIPAKMGSHSIGLAATVLNEGSTISAWLESIRQQTRMPDHFVLVDGGSKDGTWEIVRRAAEVFPCRMTVYREPMANIATGRNMAIRRTECEIVACTDAGTILPPEWLAEIISPIEADPLVQVVAGGWEFVPRPSTAWEEAIAREIDVPQCSGPFNPSGRSVAFRRQTWIDAGGYPEWTTNWAEDKWFALELRRLNKRTVYRPKIKVGWRFPTTIAGFARMSRNYGLGNAEIGRRFAWSVFRAILVTDFVAVLLITTLCLWAPWWVLLAMVCLVLSVVGSHAVRLLTTRFIVKHVKLFGSLSGYTAGMRQRDQVQARRRALAHRKPGIGPGDIWAGSS